MSNNPIIASRFEVMDLETRPDKEAARKHQKPYPDFDPDKVALGNATKPDTIARIKKDAKDKHALKSTEKAYYDDYAKKHCGLVPEFSQICTIGFRTDEGKSNILPKEMPEEEMIKMAWSHLSNSRFKIVGHSFSTFDIRMLVKRSWILKVHIPYGIVSFRGNRMYTCERIMDIANMWNCGVYEKDLMNKRIQWSLSYIAGVLGVAQPRNYEVKGATFHESWDSDDVADQSSARDYLYDDLLETDNCYRILDQVTNK